MSSSWIRIVRGATAALASLAVSPVGALAWPGPSDRLINPPHLLDEPGVSAVGTVWAGHERLAATLLDGAGTLIVYTSADNGRTWSPAERLGPADTAGNLCADGLGNVYTVWHESGTSEIRFGWSSDFGQSWSSWRVAVMAVARDFEVACNAAGQIVAIWAGTGELPLDVWAAGIDVSGGTPRIRLRQINHSGPFEDPHPRVALGPGRRAVAVWQTDAPFPRIRYSWTSDGGDSWSDPEFLPYPASPELEQILPDVAMAGDQAVTFVWLERLAPGPYRVRVTCWDHGSWLPSPTDPAGGMGVLTDVPPRICAGSGGTFVAFVGPDWLWFGPALFTNVSHDLGASWVYPSPVQPEALYEGVWDLSLSCDAGGRGHAVVAWGDGGIELESVSLSRAMSAIDPAWRLWELFSRPFHSLIDSKVAAATDGLGRVWLGLGSDDATAVDATTGETRLDGVEGGAGAIDSTGPAVTADDWPFVQALWAAADGRILAAVSPDGGMNWTYPEGPVATGNVGSPAVAAAAGHVLAVFTAAGPSGARALDSAVSHDHGWSFEPGGAPAPPSHQAVDIPGAVLCAASPPQGPRIYAAWVTDPNQGQVRFNYWTPGGGWFPYDTRIDTPGTEAGYASGLPVIACDDDGYVCVAWEDHRIDVDPATSSIRANCAIDGGGAWFPADVRIDPPGSAAYLPSLASGGAGRFVAAWAEDDPDLGRPVRVSHSFDGGATWSPPSTPTDTAVTANRVSVAVESHGHTVVAWTGDWDHALYVASSADWGASWRPEQSYGCADAGTNGCLPRVSAHVRHDGGAAVVYPVIPPPYGDRVDVRALTSRDYGATWQGPFALSPDGGIGFETGGAPYFIEEGPVATLAGPGGPGSLDPVVAVWTAERAQNNPNDVAALGWPVPSGIPPAVHWLRITQQPGQTRIDWFDMPEPLADGYKVYRGKLAGGGQITDWCLKANVAHPPAADAAIPSPGTALVYYADAYGPGGEGPPGPPEGFVPLCHDSPPPAD
ncbi:MAG: hypothetical protein D6718_05850 [Acidobacteria bacterium]|nr:MAG: hypothetical protein D6718_05850 [Acidobacteriota bacterium]